jgi:phosphoenolpyruvate synthase/pyruvate phosphate dikinase
MDYIGTKQSKNIYGISKMPFSENTMKAYTRNLRKLGEEGFNDLSKDPEGVVEFLHKKYDSYNTRKQYLSAIMSTYEDKKDIPQVYKEAILKEFDLQKHKEKNQVLTPEQDKNYLSWKEIMKVQKLLAKMEHKNRPQWLAYLVVSLYTLTSPVRSDYGSMKVDSRKRKTGNCFVNRKTRPYFVFREYKTKEAYGEIEVPVPKPLMRVIEEWFEHLGYVPEFLLDKEYNNIVLSNYVRDVFHRYSGKAVGINLLRHAYITEYLPKLKSIRKKEAVARKMMHSKERQELYNLPDKEGSGDGPNTHQSQE